MTYDDLDRLVGVTAGSAQGGNAVFAYDVLDNIRQLDQGTRTVRHTYDTVNRLDTIKNAAGTTLSSYDFDTRGNLSQRTTGAVTDTFTFDKANRLRSATIGGVASSYHYDGLGRRIRHQDGSQYSQFFYSQAGQLLYTNDVGAALRYNHIHLAGSLVAKRILPAAGGTASVRYQHTDALGSPVAETNEAGALAQPRERLTAYGEPADGTWQAGPGFTGHQMDATSKLVYMQQRYYDPVSGRFFSTDPLVASSTGGNFNRYWYGNNNPYKFVDPDGRESRIPEPGCFLVIYCDRAGSTPANNSNRTTPVPEDTGESAQGTEAEEKAWAATEKQAGEDGIVELDYGTEFLDVFRYEHIRINAMNQDVGGFASLDPYTFLHQIAYKRGDSKFYGAAGGKLFRISGAPASLGEGPHLGGNLNYITQGMIFAAGGRSKSQAIGAVRAWNSNGRTGSPQYREIREKMTAYGYDLWGTIK
jgi:RHS repeat-associated protein